MAGDTPNTVVVNTTPTTDPVRWWPSGVPQAWGVIGSALVTYRTLANANPRARALAVLAVTGASTSLVLIHSALVNSVGFHRFLFGLTEYNRTGIWPSIDEVQNRYTDQTVNTRLQQAIDAYKNNTGKGPLSNSLSPEQNPIIDSILKLVEVYESYNTLGKFCISILLFNYLIFSAITSIVFIFFGDYLIKRFNLEVKYPKLAKIIALRRKFQRYYLILNISYIAFAVIVETVFCLYILSL